MVRRAREDGWGVDEESQERNFEVSADEVRRCQIVPMQSPHLLWGSADEYWWSLQAVEEDGNKLLEKCWVNGTSNIVLKIVAQLSRCFNSDFDI